MTENDEAGTPAPTQEGGTAEAAGTPAGAPEGGTSSGLSDAEKQELERLRLQKEQWLGEKQVYEETRRRLEEAERQRGYGHPPATAQDPTAQAAAQAIQNLWDRDPETAQAILGVANLTQAELQRRDAELQKREAQARYERELSAIPADRRAEVERRARSQNLWPSLADAQIRAEMYDRTQNELAEQRRRLQEREDALKRGVVKTTAEPAPSQSNNNAPTRDEYGRTARLAAEGNREARIKLREWDDHEAANGPLKFRDG